MHGRQDAAEIIQGHNAVRAVLVDNAVHAVEGNNTVLAPLSAVSRDNESLQAWRTMLALQHWEKTLSLTPSLQR